MRWATRESSARRQSRNRCRRSYAIRAKDGFLATTDATASDADPERAQSSKGKQSGRTQEIQRLIGRSLRAVADLKQLGERTIWIDCDVIQADGGTRTASIAGAFVALGLALQRLIDAGTLTTAPIRDFVAAISVGIVDGEILLDLNYEEDSRADVDMNFVMTAGNKIVELQATAEHQVFDDAELAKMISVARQGIQSLIAKQQTLLLGDSLCGSSCLFACHEGFQFA